jgi:hypothetical protein
VATGSGFCLVAWCALRPYLSGVGRDYDVAERRAGDFTGPYEVVLFAISTGSNRMLVVGLELLDAGEKLLEVSASKIL